MTDMITWSSQRNVTSVEGVPVTSTPVAGPVRWEMMALGLLVIATAFGNILLCVAVITDRQLQNMTNYFLTSLAVADLLVAIVVMPLAVVVQIYGMSFVHDIWPLSRGPDGGVAPKHDVKNVIVYKHFITIP